jgi:hypothetical protein
MKIDTHTPELIHSTGSPSLAASANLLASTIEHFCSPAKPTHAYPKSSTYHLAYIDPGWIREFGYKKSCGLLPLGFYNFNYLTMRYKTPHGHMHASAATNP